MPRLCTAQSNIYTWVASLPIPGANEDQENLFECIIPILASATVVAHFCALMHHASRTPPAQVRRISPKFDDEQRRSPSEVLSRPELGEPRII